MDPEDRMEVIDWGSSEAPKGPPGGLRREVPEWFRPVFDFLRATVIDEAVLLDLSFEHALGIVEMHHNAGFTGIDHFPASEGGQSVSRAGLCAIAAPLAVELYRNALANVEKNRGKFDELVKEAVSRRDSGIARPAP